MELRAKCKFDLESMRALIHLMMFGKANPKKRMFFWSVCYAFLLFYGIYRVVMFDADWFSYIFFLLPALIILWGLYCYFILPKLKYEGLGKMKESENEYLFYEDKCKIFTKITDYSAEEECEYSLFIRAFESSKYFFLYKTNNSLYLIDKSTIEGGTAQDIRNILMPHVSKYVICNY